MTPSNIPAGRRRAAGCSGGCCAEMLFATVGQGPLFVWMMAAGALIGLWGELVGVLRRAVSAGFWLNLLCDLLFALGGALMLALALVAGNYGQPRPFALMGALLGLIAFECGLAPPLRAFARALRHIFRKIVTGLSENRLIKIIFR